MQKGVSQGFTLIEMLVAFVVLTGGLIGAVALQVEAKRASFDALQRVAALGLGNDIIQRMRANKVATAANSYNREFSYLSKTSSTSCINLQCTPNQLANHDINQWIHFLQSDANTKSGGLVYGNVCINTNNGGRVEVVVSWRGRNKTADADNTSDAQLIQDCGNFTGDEEKKYRRQVVLTSYILGS